MNIVITVLIVIASIIALLLIIAAFTKKGYNTHTEITIDAPLQKVFDYLKLIKNQDNFNIWIMVDPDLKREFKGTDGTVGFIYAWDGNKKAGEGEQEIKAIAEGKYIETEIRFVRPLAGLAHAKLTTESVSDHQTKVTWTTSSNMKYPFNIMVSMVSKMLEKDMHTSLTNLKGILEKNQEASH